MAITRITKGVIKPNENYDTHNIVSTGIVTSVGLDVNGNADISGSLSVGGVLTYEDVTSIDSVGIITAQKDIHVGAGVSAVGVGTFGSLDIGGDIDVDGHTNLDNVSVAGVSTFTSSSFPIVAHADTNYQGILVNGNNAPSVGFNIGNNATPSWKVGLSGNGHTNFALSTGTSNSDVIRVSTSGETRIFGSLIVSSATITNLTLGTALIHDGDTNTKLLFGTDTIDLQTGGSTRLRAENSGLVITGVSTFSSNIDANGDLDVDGHTNLDNVSISGVVTASSYRGDGSQLTGIVAGLSTVSGVVNVANDLDVDGHTNLDNTNIVGVATVSTRLNINTVSGTRLAVAGTNYPWRGQFMIKDTNTNNTAGPYMTFWNGNEANDGSNTGLEGRAGLVNGGASNERFDFWCYRTGTPISFATQGTERLRINSSGHVVPGADSTYDLGLTGTRFRNFYADTLYGDGSNLTGITAGLSNIVEDTSPQLGGDLDTNGHEISLDDDHKIKFGASSDLQIYHSASAGNSFIDDNGSGNLRIRTVNGNGIELIYGTGTLNLKTHYNGGVDLHYTGTKRFETTSSGVTISGNANFANNNKAIFGTGNDAEIYHNDTDFHIDAQGSGATRGIYITAGTVSSPFITLRTNDGEDMLKCLPDDGVYLYHNGNLKLRTTSAGTELRGDVHFDNHTNTGKDIYWDESNDRLSFNDNVHATFGNGEDLRIYHTGSETHIKGTGAHGIIISTNNSERWGFESGGHFKPHANNAYDLGHPSYRIRNIYVNDLQLSNESKKDTGGNDVDGTWGDWTLQEGEDKVFMINNRTGKRYSLKMEEE